MCTYLGLKRKGAKAIFVFLVVTFLFASHTIGGLIPNAWLKTLVLIEIEKEVDAFKPWGTGFLVSKTGDQKKKSAILVTNAHIFNKNKDEKPLVVRVNRKDPGPDGEMFERIPIFPISEDRYKPRFHNRVDLAMAYLKKPVSLDMKVLDILTFKDSDFLRKQNIPLGDGVFLIGFPTSIEEIEELQKELNIPILREGIIAAKYQIDDLDFLMVDVPGYWGDSGSPVLIKPSILHVKGTIRSPDKSYVIGIQVKMCPIYRKWKIKREGKEEWETVESIWHSGLSIVIPIDYLIELIDELPN